MRKRSGVASPVPWWGPVAHGPGRELEMRWARWAVRHFAKYLPDEEREMKGLPPLDGKLHGRPRLFYRGSAGRTWPTPQAEQAERWGAPVPETHADAAKIARRGYKVLAKWSAYGRR